MTTNSIKIKELMMMMPDTLNTKKEVDDYYKDAMKKCMGKKKVNDDDTKPKKELNAYQQFMKKNIKTVKEENPKLTGPEVFSMIATLWKKQKEENATGGGNKNSASTTVPEEAEDNEDTKDTKDTEEEVSVNTTNDVKEVKDEPGVKEEVAVVKKKDKRVK